MTETQEVALTGKTGRGRTSGRRTSEALDATPASPGERRLVLSLRVIVPVAILGIWWALTATKSVSALILPAPSNVFQAMWSGVVHGTWKADILSTVEATLVGFLAGLLVGLLLGAIFAIVRPLRLVLYPYVLAFQAFPKIALAPLFIVWLGYGSTTKIVIAASIAFFPVLTASMAGLSDVDRDEWGLMQTIGANKWEEFRHLRLPHAMSYIFPALDIAVVAALLGVVTGELVGSKSGVGLQIVSRSAYGDTAGIYALLIILAVIGAAFHLAVKVVHHLLPMSIGPR